MGDEHISVRLGLDKASFEKGLQGAKGAFSGFKSALASIGAGLSLKGLTDFAGEITDTSEALGVSTGWLQGWRHAASQSGVTAEKSSIALDAFAKKLAEGGKAGANIEKEILALADQVKAANDPITRVKLSVDAFGKSGVKMVNVLKDGAEGFLALSNAASKMDTKQLETLANLDDTLDRAGTTMKTWGGTMVGWWAKFWANAGALYGGGDGNTNAKWESESAKKAAVEIQKARDLAAKAAQEKSDQDAGDKAVSAALEQERAYDKQDIETAKEKLALTEARAAAVRDVFAASAALINMEQAAKQAKQDRSGSTLGDLANSRAFTPQGRRNVALANEAQDAEAWAKQYRIEGRDDLAERATNNALNIRKRLGALTGSEQNPLSGVKEEIVQTNGKLQELLNKLTDGSATVAVVSGE
jgi:hypothetical protein